MLHIAQVGPRMRLETQNMILLFDQTEFISSTISRFVFASGIIKGSFLVDEGTEEGLAG